MKSPLPLAGEGWVRVGMHDVALAWRTTLTPALSRQREREFRDVLSRQREREFRDVLSRQREREIGS